MDLVAVVLEAYYTKHISVEDSKVGESGWKKEDDQQQVG